MSFKDFTNKAVLVVTFAGAVGSMSGCDATYSEGDRTGPITKFSNKGVLVKTWEGEMAMNNFKATAQGGTDNTFAFSVKDPNIVHQIQEAQEDGGNYKLHYRQVFIANPFEMESDYIVTGIEKVKTQSNKENSLQPGK